MHVQSVLASLVVGFGLARAAPAANGFSTSCSNLTLRSGWLIGNCLTGQDNSTRIQSAVYLPNKVTNAEASLQWKVDGAYSNTCSSCQLTPSGAALNCICNHSWNAKENTTLNLEDHIATHAGHLLSDLSEPPTTTIPPNSTYPIPANFSYSVNYDCHRGVYLQSDGPQDCFAVTLPPTPANFSSLNVEGNGGWEVTAYADVECKGEPLVRITPETGDACERFGTAVGFKVVPLFNAD